MDEARHFLGGSGKVRWKELERDRTVEGGVLRLDSPVYQLFALPTVLDAPDRPAAPDARNPTPQLTGRDGGVYSNP
jgi:hypothetical protein